MLLQMLVLDLKIMKLMSNTNIFPYKVSLPITEFESVMEISQWCKKQGWLQGTDYAWRCYDTFAYFYFNQEDNVSWFKMRWE
jgi:hypothetical protein